MNSNLHISLNKRWMGNLLGLLVILSMMLSTMAAAPMAVTPSTETPAAPAAASATPVPATATQPAAPTDTSAPKATETSPAATDTVPAATSTAPSATSTAPAATNTVPAATETAVVPTEATSPTVQPTPTTPAPTQPAPAKNSAEASRVNYHKIIVKFKTSASTQVGAQSTTNPPTSAAVLKGLTVKPLFPGAASSTSQSQLGAQAQTAAPVPNLSTYSIVNLPSDTSYDEAVQILKGLQSSDDVQLAYMEPIYRPADIGTQPYLDTSANSNGIDAVDANLLAGGKGENVRVTDVEGGWQIGHEDLPIKAANLFAGDNSSDPNWVNHGTAVLGIIAGQGVNSNYNITGIAPKAELHMVSALSMDTATAIYEATQISRSGDIIVIPMEALGPVSGDTPPAGCDPTHFEDIPVEYYQANFDAIQAATANGIIVIEAAGDGSMNLDDTITPTHPKQIYGNAFNRNSRDSGAILVGAGSETDRSPLCFSDYGSRVDVQGWGENIATTGGDGDQTNGGTADQTYTDDFGGTSGAAAMVTGAAASLQGIYKNVNGSVISPSSMRKLLVKTGAPQAGTNHIGPLPNLDPASKQVKAGPTLLVPADGATVNTLKPTLDWSFLLNVTSFEVEVDSVGTSWANLVVHQTTSGTELTIGSSLTSNTTYYWRVRGSITTTYYDPTTQNHTTTTTVTPWSTPQTFIISPQVGKASTPKLYAPSNNTTSIEDPTNSFYSPVLSWYDPSNPVGLLEYKVEISTSYIFAAADTNLGIDTQSFTIPYSNGITPGITNTSSNPLTLLNEESTYYWHVASCYIGSPEYCSAWSGRWVLYTGLLAPSVQDLTPPYPQELRPTFTWSDTDAALATAYYLQVAQENLAKNPITYKQIFSATIGLPKGQTLVPTTYTMTRDLPKNLQNLVFRVAVKGKNVWSYSPYSDAFSTGTPPANVSLLAPSNKSVFYDSTIAPPFSPTFSWKPTKDYLNDTYNIQISNTSDFETTDPTKNISTMMNSAPIGPASSATNPVTFTFPTALNPQTIYYWHVQSYDGTSYSDWSSTYVLYTAILPPTNLVDPVADSLSPTFNWDTVVLAKSYQIEVASDAAFKHLVANVITSSGPPFVLPVTLPTVTTLYWQVRADGLYGWSDWAQGNNSFTTLSTPPTLLSPTNKSNIPNFNPTLDWKDLPVYPYSLTNTNYLLNPSGYDVQIATNPDFDSASMIFDSTTSSPPPVTVPSNFLIPGNLLQDTDRYYWRVRSENGTADGVSAWSQPFSFYTPAIVSGTVKNLAGGTLAGATVQIGGKTLSTITDANGNFQFFGLPGGQTYRLYVSDFGTDITAPNGYIRQAYNVTTSYGQDSVVNFNLVPVPPIGTMKIVLTWEGTPNNLEANLWLPKNCINTGTNNGCLVNEENVGALGTDPHARMDTPNSTPVTAGFGPEVITLDENPSSSGSSTNPYVMAYGGIYTYAVHINSSLGTFSQSNAVVTVYDGPNITFMKVFNVPSNGGSNTWWKVFTITGNTRAITTINQVVSSNPQPYTP
ncbi:MAG: carboxypeptidase regulatory-like domain-containing protein [Anaerolineaceae bacterium]|nr:carboxypeptidase regulatory-like domain-containing protein [Anaerolineaceae bacterium]